MTSLTDAPENPLPSAARVRAATGSGRAIRWLRAKSVLVDSFERHLAAADLPARKGLRELRAVGFLERDLDRSGQSDRRLPGNPRARRLLGRRPREYRFILFGTYPFDQQWRPGLRP